MGQAGRQLAFIRGLGLDHITAEGVAVGRQVNATADLKIFGQALQLLPGPKQEGVAALEAPLTGKDDVAGEEAVRGLVGNIIAVESAGDLPRSPAPGTRGGLEEPAKAPNAGARHKAHAGLKIPLHLPIGAEYRPGIVGQIDLTAPGPVLARRGTKTLQHKRRQGEVAPAQKAGGFIQKVMPVEAGCVPVLRCPAGRDQSHRCLFSDIALESDHAEILARYGVAFLGLGAEYPQGILAYPTAEFCAADQVNRFAVVGNADAPAEKGDNHQRPRGRGQAVHRKIGRILQKELPLFGEEKREACQVDLHIVRLGLGKVGIEGQAERQAGGGFVEQIKARLEGRGIAAHLGSQKRRKIEPQTLGPVAQSGESAGA